MITSAAFIAIMLVGVPIGLCLCLAGFVYIIASGNPVLFQSYPLQLFGGVENARAGIGFHGRGDLRQTLVSNKRFNPDTCGQGLSRGSTLKMPLRSGPGPAGADPAYDLDRRPPSSRRARCH